MQHGGYKCSKCGETASSKCMRQRSVFPTNQYAVMLGNALKINAERMGATKEQYRNERCSNLWEVTFTFSATVLADNEDQAIEESNIANCLVGMNKETLRIALCDHKWVPTSVCGFGCCVPPVAAPVEA